MNSFADRSIDQIAAAVEGFFWPKIFWDFLTKNLDLAVKPLPILQIINLVFGIFMFAWEWPLGVIAGTSLHRSIETRLVILPLTALASALLYQATNPAIYYTIGMVVYFWAYSEGEVGSLKHDLVSAGANRTPRLWSQSRGIFLLVLAPEKSRRPAFPPWSEARPVGLQ
jgi:hypothetical protein